MSSVPQKCRPSNVEVIDCTDWRGDELPTAEILLDVVNVVKKENLSWTTCIGLYGSYTAYSLEVSAPEYVQNLSSLISPTL